MNIIVVLVLSLVSMSVTGGLYIKHILTDRAALVLQVESVTEKLQFEKDQNKLSEERVITLERSRDKAEENVVYLRELYNGHDLNKLIAANGSVRKSTPTNCPTFPFLFCYKNHNS